MSGTSVDGIDAALVKISGQQADLNVELVAAHTYPYSDELRSQILQLAQGTPLSLPALAEVDDKIAKAFAEAALSLQANQRQPADLIGSHGQTVYHRPPVNRGNRYNPQSQTSSSKSTIDLGYSLQLGRGAMIAHLTGITTVSNFRAADIAVQGQGAPLVPRIDVCLLGHPTQSRCIQNIGGIGNLTYLPPAPLSQLDAVCGWDTGPGNLLLDLAVAHFSKGQQTFDRNGAWAASGTPCQALVQHWLQDPYFAQEPPKSTGREYFGVEFLDQCLTDARAYALSPADLLATLTELTARSIVENYRQFLPQMPDCVLLCGGGSRNLYLKERLQQLLAPRSVLTTDEVGVSAEFKEAIAFAVLGYWRVMGIPGNLPRVTGAKGQAMPLGDIFRVESPVQSPIFPG
ncbi:MAG: anhydro-N-acetylmuramic acid kinase [Desertifilum sp. SIO1I2]|nr:anhydro-N-acetylmuramic acid kinase [Desertifilum sp. SIO1I2]